MWNDPIPTPPYATPFWGSAISVQSTTTDPYNSDISTIDTVKRMIAVSVASSRSTVVLATLRGILSSHSSSGFCPSDITDKVAVVRCIYWWVKQHVTFSEDETIATAQLGYPPDLLNTASGAIDLLISPESLLGMPKPTGDCDDYSMLLASLLIASGLPVWFVTVAVDSSDPMRFSHVYVKTMVSGCDWYLDASHGSYPGWEVDRVYRKMEWRVS